MKGNKRWLLALLAGVMALPLTACGQLDEEKSGASQMPAQELTGSKRAEEHTCEEATDLNYEDWLDYGWHWATTEELKETTDLILGKSQDGARFPWQETAAQTGMLIRSYG